jgi:hypothetical protein
MEDKVIKKTINDVIKYKADIINYKSALEDYSRLEDNSKEVKPVYPQMTKKEVEVTTQVQKVINKTKYRFTSKFPFIERYTVKVPQFTETQETSSRIKLGYFLNQDTGEFCKK